MVNLPKSMLWTTALKLPSQYPELSSQYPREQNYQNVTLFINLAILVTNLFKFILNRAQAKRGGGERILVKICQLQCVCPLENIDSQGKELMPCLRILLVRERSLWVSRGGSRSIFRQQPLFFKIVLETSSQVLEFSIWLLDNMVVVIIIHSNLRNRMFEISIVINYYY